jgi:CRP-like cAMP-binding protein
MTTTIEDALSSSLLFAGLSLEELKPVAAGLAISRRTYDRDEVIAFEEDACTSLGLISQGSLRVQRIYPSGKSITIDTLRSGSSFGEALIFADDGRYPATLIANEEAEVLFLPKEEIARLCAGSPQFMTSFLKMLSNRILMLNQRIKSFSYQTIQQKVAAYLLQEYSAQKTLALTLPLSRHAQAAALGIPRPSLSRELIRFREEGWINFDRAQVEIRDLAALERALG